MSPICFQRAFIRRLGVLFATLMLAALPTVPRVLRAQVTGGQRETDGPRSLFGAWRVTTSRVAPWVGADSASVNRTTYRMRTVRLGTTAFSGVGPLSCSTPQYESTAVPPEALFQGNLPAPAADVARALGFAKGTVHGMRLMCVTGTFEFHIVDAMHLMVAIDNVIWTLDRSPGALAKASTPEGVVNALLEKHFSGDMGFDSASAGRVRPYLSAAFAAQIDRYLATPGNPDEVPAIDGDPFTDTQEYPTRFSVQRSTVNATRASVAVRLADGFAKRSLRYDLRSGPSGWRVNDITYDDGGTFTALLRVPESSTPTTNASAPKWAELAWAKESVARGLVRDSTVKPVILMADLDGDGVRDVAWLVRKRTTGARGVLIVHASGRVAQQCGAGVKFGNGGDNFDWMDSWKVVPGRNGKGSALLVEKSESASGRIEFRAGRYQWIQVGD